MTVPNTKEITNLKNIPPDTRNLLVCPECGKPLEESSGGASCGTHDFPAKNGYLSLNDQDFYYGEIPLQEMRGLLQEIGEVGYSRAVGSFFRLQQKGWRADFLYRYIFDPCRASWIYLGGLQRRRRVLDLGCGWGTLLTTLARVFDEAVGMDMTGERLEFTAQRARHEGISNLTLIKGGATLPLPFADGSFDLVALNGVLEWVPEGTAGDPRQVQRRFLAEVQRILAPGGEVYIGIENRLAYSYFLGMPEDHTALRFGALLPRPLANLYSLLKRRKSYRTYTYSRAGYRALLSEAGLPAVRISAVYPDYRFPSRYLFPALRDRDDTHQLLFNRYRGSLKHAFRHLVLPLAAKSGVLERFAHSFAIVGARAQAPSFIEQVLAAHALQPSDASTALVTDGEVLAVLAGEPGSGAVFKFPLSVTSLHRLHRAERAIRLVRAALGRTETPPVEAVPLQKVLSHSGLQYASAPLVAGRNILQSGFQPRHDALAALFLQGFHAIESKPCALSEDRLHALFYHTIGTHLAPLGASRPSLAANLEQVMKRCSGTLAGITLAMGYCHGDFHAGNIIVESGAITGVIDWDRFSTDGVQGLDQLHYDLFKAAALQGKTASQLILDELELPLSGEKLLLRFLFLLRIISLYGELADGCYFPGSLLTVWDAACSRFLARLS